MFLDPDPYLAELSRISPELPLGARAFATEVGHYDFTSIRCVKDLQFAECGIREVGRARVQAAVTFRGNKWKHDADLVIRYLDVIRFECRVSQMSGSVDVWPESRRLGDVQLDEILPTSGGCVHELKLTGGTLLVECADLNAEWISLGGSC